MKYANLHLHSVYSDSQLTPYQLVLIGKSLGYRALALTDHWTDAGIPEFSEMARRESIETISGVEFDAKDLGVSFHITALDFDTENSKIKKMIKDQVEARTECSRKCFERGVSLGYVEGITWDDVIDFVDEGSWVCFDHIVGAMRYKRVIPQVGNTSDLRQKLFKAPEVAAFSPKKPSTAEIIKTIREAGGIATLAHPYKQIKYLPQLIELGINGIEVSHPELIEEYTRLACEAADTYKLYRSGGTDHTGAMSGCDGVYATSALQGITEEEFMIIKERRLG
ncbi:MAG: PHP domain-containing protein [Ruminococcaceae bacterium]|nr:PHP domain-containing protein [Oscillospiraceae bacterium]